MIIDNVEWIMDNFGLDCGSGRFIVIREVLVRPLSELQSFSQ